MARSDPRRVLAAQLSGAAAAFAHQKRLTADEALAEIEAELRNAKVKPGSPEAVLALTMAAGLYVVDGEPAIDQYWYRDALALLVRAGADDRAARRARAARGSQRMPGDD
jgi:hypothetical protein